MHNSVLLDNLGIQQWWPRKLRHPWYKTQQVVVTVTPAILLVKCLVLLPLKKNEKTELTPAVEKILTGMLSVLDLAENELSIAKIYARTEQLTEQNWQQVFTEIAVWQPRFILQLDKTAPVCSYPTIVGQTYHPEHLWQNQQDKAAAYKDLLAFKNKLHINDYHHTT
jgi:hypothetical protein